MRAAKAYQSVKNTTGVIGANPVRLTIMLYERITDELTKAEAAVKSNDIRSRTAATSKVLELIEVGLIPSLDRENGGTIASNLSFMYKFWVAQILDSNLKGDPAKLAIIKDQVNTIMGAFKEVVKAL